MSDRRSERATRTEGNVFYSLISEMTHLNLLYSFDHTYWDFLALINDTQGANIRRQGICLGGLVITVAENL